MTGHADELWAELLRVLPTDTLVRAAPAVEIPATWCLDSDWIQEQIRLRGDIWGIDDRFVLGTLWWYSASTWLVMPAVTSWYVTGRALSPRLEDTRLFHRPDSRIPGSRSVSIGPEPIADVAALLGNSLAQVIDVLAAIIGKGERRLWSFAVDAIVGRLLWAGQLTGRTAEVLTSADRLISQMGRALGVTLPAPRLTTTPTGESHLRRGSCCLLYRVPAEAKCSTCPRQLPQERLARLTAAGARPKR
ncbi:(2Fe-2S)-binding protein [Cumulibacter soli]|uniref:(2Fe-2S)-binding protein n=1 Tax=Cumulibacter soli TaxID=2546344 RepID=UPI0010677E72|nr:(2Fe-2S)-binding protein [Cumulibacter soli]